MTNIDNCSNRKPCNLLLIRQIINEYSNVKQVASEVVIVQRTVALIPYVYTMRQSFIRFPIFQTVSEIFDCLARSHFCEFI